MAPSTTLVTAFYPIRSKFPPQKYIEWASNFLTLSVPIVLFTDAQSEQLLRGLRGDRPIHIIVQPFEETYMWKTYSSYWIRDHANDREAHIHTPELYSVWANKAAWLREAIEANPFGATHFFWCDIGAFRDMAAMHLFRERFPDATKFPSGRVLFSSVERCTADDYVVKDCIIGDFYHKNRLVGGLFGGEPAACVRWLAAYEAMLQRYFARGRFAGKDQSVMVSALLGDSSLGVVIRPTMECNEWFFLEYYLSGVIGANFEEDTTFRVVADATVADATVANSTANAAVTTGVANATVVSARIMGGLGNQMFQLATAYALARSLNAQPRFFRKKLAQDGRDVFWDTILENWQPYLVDELPTNLLVLKVDDATTYYALPDSVLEGGYFLDGYFQSPKYFSAYSKELYNLFVSQRILRAVQERYGWLLQLRERAVIVHARRTDYLKNQHNIDFHGPLTIDYYRSALSHMSSKVTDPIFLLFSDDNNFWYEHVGELPELKKHSYVIVNENDTSISLTLMSQFSNYVIANSTFSWWAAWLAGQVRATNVIVPRRWFGPIGPANYEDIYVEDWIRM